MRKKTVYQETQEALQRKLDNPKDSDDPRWVKRILDGAKRVEAKKLRAIEHKQQQRKGNRRRRSTDT